MEEGDRFAEINIGDEAELFHTVTVADVDTFANLTGDNNPLHVDENYAASTTFKKRVVHGMLTASFISTMIGTKLPGKGSLWYEQQSRFLAPVRIGETIRVWGRVKHKSPAQRVVVLETVVFGEGGRKVIEGEAKVKMLQSEGGKKLAGPSVRKGTVIISGASRGIGAAIAKELASAGYPVVVNYFSSREAAENVLREIHSQGGEAISFKANVTDPQAVKAMVEEAAQTFGGFSGIVNNASAPIELLDFNELSWDEFQKHIDVSLKGTFHLTQAVLPHLLAQKSGVVVNISSISADNVPPVKMSPYNMVKGALIAFTRSLTAEYGPKGIRFNAISPGMTQTDLIANMPEKVKMVTKMQTPLRRLAQAEDIAGVVAFLFSDKASFITGQNIRVCGGIIMA